MPIQCCCCVAEEINLYRRAKKDKMVISINKNEVLVKGVSIKDHDIIFNYTLKNDQLMDDLVLWRGA